MCLKIQSEAAYEPTWLWQVSAFPCGSWLVGSPHRSDGCVADDQRLSGTPRSNRRSDACSRWTSTMTRRCLNARFVLMFFASKLRSYRGSRSLQTRQTEAAYEPTWLWQVSTFPCGSWLASDGDLTGDQRLSGTPDPIVGASLLAKNAQTTRASRHPASSLTSIAGKPRSHRGKRSRVVRSARRPPRVGFGSERPVNHDGRTQVLRSGETGRTPV